MLKLLRCELWKLKRKRFIQLVIAAAFLFPAPLTVVFKKWPGAQGAPAEEFDLLWQSMIGYGVQLLLPCVLGIVAALLFFSERDNNTWKSLRTIPVSGAKLVIAKITLLFVCSIIFCVASTLASASCGMIAFAVQGLGYKLWMSVKVGLYITAGTLPLIAVIVLCNRTYIFSILLCVFYSVLNDVATFVMGALPKAIVYLLPVPLTTLWSANDMAKHMAFGDADDLAAFADLVPSEAAVIAILSVMAAVSVCVIIRLYNKEG